MQKTMNVKTAEINQDMQIECSVCGSVQVKDVIDIFQVPVHCNVLYPTREHAIRAPKSDIRLGFCGQCGHIFNRVFDPALMQYSPAYENSLHFSPRFRQYVKSLALDLVDRHGIRGKRIVEIGCGDGDFLRLLCQLGDNSGVGFDPSHSPARGVEQNTDQIRFVQDFYSEKYADCEADLICCRHTLEHIDQPRRFLDDLRHIIGGRRDTIVFFEVPNVMFTLGDLGIWDLIYEHYSYFSVTSIARLFASCGFHVTNVHEAYDGQFLCVEAVPSENLTSPESLPSRGRQEMDALVAEFGDAYRQRVATMRSTLEHMASASQRVVVWGTGSKGVTFLNVLRTQDQIEYAVDINPRKQGMYVAGTGQKIMSPDFLKDYRPDIVLLMNRIYFDEVTQNLRQLGVNSEVVPL